MHQPYPPPQRHVQKRGANHTLHIVLTICTCGLWAVTGWPIAAIMGRKQVTTTYPPQPPAQPGYGYPPPNPYAQQPGPYNQQPGTTPPYGHQQPPPGPYPHQ